MTNVEVKDLRTTLDALIAERTSWETNELARSNKRLYELLADCYRLAEEIKANRDKQKRFKAILDERNVTLSGGSNTLTKVIKLVFGTERRRASTYSLAVRAAKAAGVEPEGLAEWLTEQGGVEEVRLASSNSDGNSPKQQRALHQDAGESEMEAMAPFGSIEKKAATPDAVGPVLIAAYVRSDFSTDLMRFVENETLVNMVLAHIGKQARKAAKDAAANDNTAVDEAIEDAVQSVGDDIPPSLDDVDDASEDEHDDAATA